MCGQSRSDVGAARRWTAIWHWEPGYVRPRIAVKQSEPLVRMGTSGSCRRSSAWRADG